MTSGGTLRAQLDKLLMKAYSAAGKDQGTINRLRHFRDEIQAALLPDSICRLGTQYVDSMFDYWSSQTIKEGLDTIKQIVHELVQVVNKRERGVSPFPFFFRIVTRNLIGLNQLKKPDNLDDFIAYAKHGALVEEVLTRGTLSKSELGALRGLIHLISEVYPSYYDSLSRWTPQPLHPVLNYLPDGDMVILKPQF